MTLGTPFSLAGPEGGTGEPTEIRVDEKCLLVLDDFHRHDKTVDGGKVMIINNLPSTKIIRTNLIGIKLL